MKLERVLGGKVTYSERGGVSVELPVKDLGYGLKVLGKSTLSECKVLIDVIGERCDDGSVLVRYMLLSVRYSRRVEVVIRVREGEGVESICDIFGNGGWLEREVKEMYGVWFVGNKDMRRLLSDYGRGEGKDVYGEKEEVRYREESKVVEYM